MLTCRETSKLWDLVSEMGEFEFKTIQDVIEELAKCEIQLECLTGDIQSAIAALQMEMTDRKVEIDLLEDTTFKMQAELNQVEANHSTDLKNVNSFMMNLQSEIFLNRDLIHANEETIDTLHLAPLGELIFHSSNLHNPQDPDTIYLGSIIAWVPRTNGNQADIALPEGWIRCDGG